MDKEIKKRGTNKAAVFFGITTLAAAAFAGFVSMKYIQLDSQVNAQIYTQQDVDEMVEKQATDTEKEWKEVLQKYMEDGVTPLNALREMYPEDTVFNYAGKYYFEPVLKDIPLNELNNDNFKKNDAGEIEYYENEKVVSHKGIDVSKFQGTIDWDKVAADGVEYAFIRLGYRGYGTGAIVIDETFTTNIEAAKKAGIKVGVYFFSQAVTKKEAKEEAKFVIENLKPYKIDCPVVFDTEEIAGAEGRLEDLSKDELTDVTVEFLEAVKKEGYTPMIYANLKWFIANLDMARLKEYDKWFAAYTMPLYFPYEISVWQYSESGKVDGIVGNVDMNISFKEWK